LIFEEIGWEIRHQNTYSDILTPEAVGFLVTLTRVFRDQLNGLLKERTSRNLLDHTVFELPDENWRVLPALGTFAIVESRSPAHPNARW